MNTVCILQLCTIVAGQVTQRKLDDNQTSKMIREAATDTHRRKAKIMEGVRMLCFIPVLNSVFVFSIMLTFL